MPGNIDSAISFLETQWSSINANKLKGISAELRFEHHLNSAAIRPLYEYIIPGGWILSPGRNTVINPPTQGRIAILPIPTPFSWTDHLPDIAFAAQVLAESYFRQTGIKTYFARFETFGNVQTEAGFQIPQPGNYHTSYALDFYKTGPNGLSYVAMATVMSAFTPRTGNRGMSAHATGRIDRTTVVWADTLIVTNLFWKEYAYYYLKRQFSVSAADLDFFIVGNSGKAYPIEFKSKTTVTDAISGDWFGIDINPFAKLSFFVSLSNNMEALFFIEEVDNNGNTIEWWGVRFSVVLKNCYWVPQPGGRAMGGGGSSTIKIPKVIFSTLVNLLPTL